MAYVVLTARPLFLIDFLGIEEISGSVMWDDNCQRAGDNAKDNW